MSRRNAIVSAIALLVSMTSVPLALNPARAQAPPPQAPAPAPTQPAPPPYGMPITLEAAKQIMAAAEAEAEKNKWPVVIVILDSGGNVVMLHRRDDAQLGAISTAEGKARTALQFKRPTKLLDEVISAGGGGLRYLALKDVVPLEGGMPITIDGKIVGAIGVSGVLSTQDTQVARAGIDAVAK